MATTAPPIVSVSSQANIYLAGKLEIPTDIPGGGGELPPHFRLATKPGSSVSFPEITGSVLGLPSGDGVAPHSAEGYRYFPQYTYGVNIAKYNGLSGIHVEEKCMCLLGVFLPHADARPETPPADLFVTSVERNLEIVEPQLFQPFFIGDGKTDAGVVQRFTLPRLARRLFLGFACAEYCGGNVTDGATPSAYADNSGDLEVEMQFIPPET